jgi:hypothetical protein
METFSEHYYNSHLAGEISIYFQHSLNCCNSTLASFNNDLCVCDIGPLFFIKFVIGDLKMLSSFMFLLCSYLHADMMDACVRWHRFA